MSARKQEMLYEYTARRTCAALRTRGWYNLATYVNNENKSGNVSRA
jgi:hypothetical protein